MKLFFILGALMLFVTYIEAKQVVCYIPEYGPDITSKVDTSLCTMFMVSFGTVDASGNIGVPKNIENYKKLKTPTSKLLLAIGGAVKSAFKTVAATATGRATFAQNCLNVVRNNGLDGIDIDWEFPDKDDRASFVALLQEIRNKFGSAYLLTAAVSVGKWLVVTNNVYDIPGVARNVDFINLMAYDLHMDAAWDKDFGVFFNAPVKASAGDTSDLGITYWLQGGAPASKLTIGAPFYSRIYELVDPARNAPRSPFVVGLQSEYGHKPGYNLYCKKLVDSTWTKKRDATALCPYMYKGYSWITYEDEQSIIDKGKLAVQYNLGGVMVWSIHHDDYDGVCSSCKWPLLKALNSAIGRAPACSRVA
uniref:CSON000032 protein n=1 Tax=Culicoides sonorensis TaxID=179676 RepID=A0A336MDM2_CULSO